MVSMEIASYWRRFSDVWFRLAIDRYGLFSQVCFGSAVLLLFDGYTFNLFGGYLADSTEIAISYVLLLMAYLSLQSQYQEDHQFEEKRVMREREEFLRKERDVSALKTNIARDLKRERQSGSKQGRYSALNHRDSRMERDSVLDNYAERRSTSKFGGIGAPQFGSV